MLSNKTNRLKSTATFFVREHKDILFAISVSIVSFMFTMQLNSLYVLPPGADPSCWLRYAHVLAGDTKSFWSWDPLSKPLSFNPLILVILMVFIKLTGNEIFALKLLGSVVLALIPFSTYLVAKKILYARANAVIACVFVAFFPAFFEMWGWGGYPNILGISLLSIALYFIFSIINMPRIRDVVIATIVCVAIVYTHHLTALVFFTILALYMLFLTWRLFFKKEKARQKPLIALFVITLLTLIFSIPLIIVLKDTFLVSNTAAKAFIITSDLVWYIFKSPWLLGTAIVLVAVHIILLSRNREITENILFVLLWLLAPLLLTQLYVLSIYADFNRFPYFSILPLSILIADSYNRFKVSSRFLKMFLSSLIILSLIISSTYGIAAALGANEYNHFIISGEGSAFSDKDIYEAILWIKENTSSNGTILTSTVQGLWIRALANVKATFPEEAKWVFIKGLIRAAMDAETMFTSEYETRNSCLQVREINELGEKYLLIRAYNGEEYADNIQLWDSNIFIEKVDQSGVSHIIRLNETNLDYHEATNYGEFVRLSTYYTTQGVLINKTVELYRESSEAKVSLTLSSLPNSGSRIAKFWMTLQTSPALNVRDMQVEEKEHKVVINEELNTAQVIFSADNLTSIRVNRDHVWFTSAFYNLTAATKQLRASVIFNSTVGQRAPSEMLNDKALFLGSKEELLRKYNVEYVALLHSDPYLRLIESDTRFSLAYENTKVKIFSLKLEG